MKLLLDTHIWLWSLISPDKLNKKTIDVFTDNNNQFFLSPITLWETMILAEKGKIELDLPPEVWIRIALKRTAVKEAKLTNAIAVKSRLIEIPHNDPADRFIAATALEYNLILITADDKLKKAKCINLLF